MFVMQDDSFFITRPSTPVPAETLDLRVAPISLPQAMSCLVEAWVLSLKVANGFA